MDPTDPQIWASLLTLTALEIVLGIDNIIFLSIIVAKLPDDLQARARIIGLGGALVFRIVLLASLAWIIGLTKPILTVFEFQLSWRDLILGAGGLFLLYKGTLEIHEAVESSIKDEAKTQKTMSFGSDIYQIMMLDIIFSIDSVITRFGDHRGRNGAARPRNDHRSCHCRDNHDGCIGPRLQVYSRTPDNQNAGAQFFAIDRASVSRRWNALPHPTQLSLFCNLLLSRCRNTEPIGPQAPPAPALKIQRRLASALVLREPMFPRSHQQLIA